MTGEKNIRRFKTFPVRGGFLGLGEEESLQGPFGRTSRARRNGGKNRDTWALIKTYRHSASGGRIRKNTWIVFDGQRAGALRNLMAGRQMGIFGWGCTGVCRVDFFRGDWIWRHAAMAARARLGGRF
jgi:hypothetical protein